MMRRFLFLITLLLPLGAAAQLLTVVPQSRWICPPDAASVANTAAVNTPEVLKTCTVPAAKLANVGDTIHLTAGGTFASSTDSKTITVKFGATTQSTITGATAGSTRWYSEVWFTKTGSNTQSYVALGATILTPVGTTSSTTGLTDTNTIAITISGTNAIGGAASVTAQALFVEFIPGS